MQTYGTQSCLAMDTLECFGLENCTCANVNISFSGISRGVNKAALTHASSKNHMNPCLLSTLESQAHHDAVPGSYRCYDLLVLHAQLSLCALNPCPLQTRCNNAPNLVHQWLACKLYCTPSKAQLQYQMLIQYSGLCVTPTFCPCQ